MLQTPCGQTGRVDFNKRTDLRLAGGGFGPVSFGPDSSIVTFMKIFIYSLEPIKMKIDDHNKREIGVST